MENKVVSTSYFRIYILETFDMRLGIANRVPTMISNDKSKLEEYIKKVTVKEYVDEERVTKFYKKGSNLEYSLPDPNIVEQWVTKLQYNTLLKVFEDKFLF